MSRGLGKIQKAILDCLEIHSSCYFKNFAESIWGGHNITLSQYAILSRAVATLIERDLVIKRKMKQSELTEYYGKEFWNSCSGKEGMGFYPQIVELK